MKRFLCGITLSAVLLTSSTIAPLANAQEVSVLLNGAAVSFADTAPCILDGSTMVPMREIFETLGMRVAWEEESGTITATNGTDIVVLQIGSPTVTVNGKEKTYAAAPVLAGDRTLVPLRAVAESLDLDVSWDAETSTASLTTIIEDDAWKENLGTIDLTTLAVTGEGVNVDGKVIRITAGGDFTVTGENSDAMIHVDSTAKVKLRLSGMNLTNTTGPAIFFENSKKSLITVSAGTENTLTDAATYAVDAKAALFSNDDLEIKGSGTLTVNGNYKHAIASDDDLVVEEGTLVLNANVNDGLHANDSITVSGGKLTITAKGDGIQSEGTLDLVGGTIDVTTTGVVATSTQTNTWGGGQRMARPDMTQNGEAGAVPPTGEMPQGLQEGQMPQRGQIPPDGMTPPDSVTIPDGQMPQREQMPQSGQTVVDNAEEADDGTASSKGLKAETVLTISGGDITVHSTGHAVHSADSFVMTGGTLTISSESGKGISAHGNLTVNGGTIDIQKATEGIESKAEMTIEDGNISIVASDDGLNAGGTGGMMMRGATEGHSITINGGTLYVDAKGDGIDSNGTLTMNGGTIIVNGPTSNGESALDCDGTMLANGGTIIAVGAAGMVEAPTSASTQNVINAVTTAVNAADSLIHLANANGEEIVTFRAAKQFQNFIYSSPLLKTGEAYTLSVGGTYSGGTDTNGVLSGGTYSGGTVVETVTISSSITTIGTAQRGGWGGGGGRVPRTQTTVQ